MSQLWDKLRLLINKKAGSELFASGSVLCCYERMCLQRVEPMLTTLTYLLPAIPFLVRGVVFLSVFRHHMSATIPEEENDRDSHRTLILALAGFSFTGLIGVAVVDANIQLHLEYAVYFLFVSFLCFFFSLNLQGYKFRRWHDQLSDALIEAATLSLLACLAVVALKIYPNTFVAGFIAVSATAVWSLDFYLRVSRMSGYLKMVDYASRDQTKQTAPKSVQPIKTVLSSLSLLQLRKRVMPNNDQADTKQSKDELDNETIECMTDAVTFLFCATHNIQHPKGSPCPVCVQPIQATKGNNK